MRLSMIASVALLALAAGCGSSSPDPNDPSQQQNVGQPGTYNPNQYQQPGSYQQTPGTTATTPGTTATPAPTTTTGASAGSPATPLAPAAAAVAQPILQGLAATEVSGMQPDGSSIAGQFQEGQVLEQPINIQAGKCYSVIGAGMGITQMDIQLVVQMAPLPPQVLAQSSPGQGGTAILGGKSAGCFKNPLPLGGPGKVIIKATKGAGIGAAQVYIK
jgi:hypothetical protein